MNIYILRHEDRTQDCSFYAPLTKEGLHNSKKLIKILREHNINKIYSSPFIRTLQTIYPYAVDSSNSICIEYGLEEINHEDIIPKKAANAVLPEYIAESFHYNPDYTTIIKPEEIVYPEKLSSVEKRTKRLLRSIIGEPTNNGKNIILVTHQCICHCIVDIIRKAKPEIKIPLISGSMEDNDSKGGKKETFDVGKLALVFNGDWTYKMLN
jgi:broad specificity phosphatase PhoE